MMESMDKNKKTKIIVKNPTQERSRQTVATILDACSRLLISEGFYSITTDKIAKEAGVSIGSLYQFFGNKESVVLAVVRQLLEEDKKLMSEGMRTVSPLPPEQRVPAMINLAFDIIRRNSELRAKLTTIQYYVADANYISDSLRFFTEIVRYNLPVIPGRDMEKVAYIVVNAFIGLVNTMNIDSPNFINDPGITEEISRLLYNYLGMSLDTASAGAPKSPKGDFI
jgi:Transcriptional regulator